ncbi:hypothetical protein RJI07_03595 [Mycoplasmatota bacterium WC30]
MKNTDFYKKLDQVYPNMTRMIPIFLVFLPIIHFGLKGYFQQLYILIPIIALIILFFNIFVKTYIARKTVVDLYKSKDIKELIRYLLYTLDTLNSQTFTNQPEHLSKINKLQELILYVDSKALLNYDNRSPLRKLDDYFYKKKYNSKKDSKVSFIILVFLNVLLTAGYLYDFIIQGNPFNWGHYAFTVGGIDLFLGWIFLSIYLHRKKECKIIEQYKNNVDEVIEYYENEKTKHTKTFGMLKKEKERINVFYDNIIQLLVDYKESQSSIFSE